VRPCKHDHEWVRDQHHNTQGCHDNSSMNKNNRDVETCRWGGHAVQLPCSNFLAICKPVYKFDTIWNLHCNEVYLLYTILYLSVYSVSSNLISSLMIANSKIAVFPDPVGADTTIDASVTK
jgi:hypothetical protein